jgi:hypothetical protein
VSPASLIARKYEALRDQAQVIAWQIRVESKDCRGGARGEESRWDILFVGLVGDVAERNMEGSWGERRGFRYVDRGGSGHLGHD